MLPREGNEARHRAGGDYHSYSQWDVSRFWCAGATVPGLLFLLDHCRQRNRGTMKTDGTTIRNTLPLLALTSLSTRTPTHSGSPSTTHRRPPALCHPWL